MRRFIDASYPCLYVTTFEIDRAIEHYKGQVREINRENEQLPKAEQDTPYEAYKWDCVDGISNVLEPDKLVEFAPTEGDGRGSRPVPSSRPDYPIRFINERAKNTILFLPNFHFFTRPEAGGVPVLQMIYNGYVEWKHRGKSIVILSTAYQMPQEIDRLFQLVDFPLPDDEFIRKIMERIVPTSLLNPDYDPSSNDTEKKTQYYIEFREDALRAAKGMTAIEIENAFSLSLIEKQEFDPIIISQIKQQQIKKSATLQVSQATHKFDDVIGLTYLKPYLLKVVNHPLAQGSMIVGVNGCIAADTTVKFKRGNRKSGRHYMISDAFYKWNHIERSNGRSGDQYFWDKDIPTYVPAWTGDAITYHRMRDILPRGVKSVYRLMTDTGRQIKATSDHPFMVLNGGDHESFMPLEHIRTGDQVVCRDLTAKGRTYRPRSELSIRYHPYAPTRIIGSYAYKRIRRSRLVVEADLNGLSPDSYLDALRTDPEAETKFMFLSPSSVVHHVDGDTMNDRRSNLEVFSSIAEHNKVHPISRGGGRYRNIAAEKVTRIEYIGEQRVFDIQMELPYTNFLGNGFVLHNCGKTHIAEALANELGLPAVIVNFENIMAAGGGIVGQAQNQAIQAFKILDAMSPCIAIFDELEKGLAGVESSGRTDSGTKAGVGSIFMKWIEKKTPGIYPVATCNDIDSLPSAYKRAGRWDTIIGVDLPITDEIYENLLYYGQKYLTDEAYESMIEILDANDHSYLDDLYGYSHAELMTIVKQMAMLECPIDDARKFVKKIWEVDKERIDTIRAWIHANATMASESYFRTPKALMPKAKEVIGRRELKIKKKKKKYIEVREDE